MGLPSFTSWAAWAKATRFFLLVTATSGGASYVTALDKIPKPPDDPAFLDVCWWALAFNDPLATGTALIAGLGAAASIYQLAGPKPAGEKLVRKLFGELRRLINRNFAAAERQQAGRHEEAMERLAGLEAGMARLVAAAERQNPSAAGPFREALTELAESDQPADVAIAQQAIDASPEAAADALMAEMAAGKRRNAERARQAARLYAPSAPAKAKAAYEQAVALDPEDIWSWIELGRLRKQYGSLADARACFGAALQRVSDDWHRMVLHNEFGSLLVASGALADARTEFSSGFAIADRLAASDASNAGWQRDLSVSQNKLGDLERAAGNLPAARTHYAASLVIRERLAASDASNAGWQRDLSISQERLGDLESAAGNPPAARTHYAASLAIRERLVASDASNAEWQRDLSVSHERLGDVEAAAGNRAAALARYRQSESIAAALAAAWSDHPGFVSDLAITRRRIAALEQASGTSAEGQ